MHWSARGPPPAQGVEAPVGAAALAAFASGRAARLGILAPSTKGGTLAMAAMAGRAATVCLPRRRKPCDFIAAACSRMPLDDPAGAWARLKVIEPEMEQQCEKNGVACVEVSHRLAASGITRQRVPTHDGDIFPLASGSLHHASAGPPHGGLRSASHNSLPKRGELAQTSFLDGDSAAAVDWAGPSDLPP